MRLDYATTLFILFLLLIWLNILNLCFALKLNLCIFLVCFGQYMLLLREDLKVIFFHSCKPLGISSGLCQILGCRRVRRRREMPQVHLEDKVTINMENHDEGTWRRAAANSSLISFRPPGKNGLL
jgi:hypothetical protein